MILSDCPAGDDPAKENSAFVRSRWFTRGWTLQKLIAPTEVIFFNQDWEDIGTKSSLTRQLEAITGIHEGVFYGDKFDTFCVAQKMSWASRRNTTRIEDSAYCLMGIFGVNMPMLYGEGERDFIRLQEEILRITDDQSIFAWRDPFLAEGYTSSFLATRPRAFAESRYFRVIDSEDFVPITISNGCVRLIMPTRKEGSSTRGLLNCERYEYNKHAKKSVWYRQCIRMRSFGRNMMGRIETDKLQVTSSPGTFENQDITNHIAFWVWENLDGYYKSLWFRLDYQDLIPYEITGVDYVSGDSQSDQSHIMKFLLNRDGSAFRFQDKLKNCFVLELSPDSVRDNYVILAYLSQEDTSSELIAKFAKRRYIDYPSCKSKTSDRLRWHWEEGNKWILVTIKKCIEGGEVLHVVHVSAKDTERS